MTTDFPARLELSRGASAVPATPLSDQGPLSTGCLSAGLSTYRQAVAWVQALPYGRNARRDDPTLVLTERRGSCSSKHAFLSALALEVGVEVELWMLLYEMSGETDPAVGPLLAAHGVASIHEAHCALRFDGQWLDYTAAGPPRRLSVVKGERITAAQVAEHKPRWHRAALSEQAAALGVPFEELWRLREGCIAALQG